MCILNGHLWWYIICVLTIYLTEINVRENSLALFFLNLGDIFSVCENTGISSHVFFFATENYYYLMDHTRTPHMHSYTHTPHARASKHTHTHTHTHTHHFSLVVEFSCLSLQPAKINLVKLYVFLFAYTCTPCIHACTTCYRIHQMMQSV